MQASGFCGVQHSKFGQFGKFQAKSTVAIEESESIEVYSFKDQALSHTSQAAAGISDLDSNAMKGVNDLEKFMGQVDDVKVPGDIGDLGGSIDQVGHMDSSKEKDNSKVEVKSRMKFRWTKRQGRT